MRRPENAKHLGLRARGVPNSPPPIILCWVGIITDMSGGRSTYFGPSESVGGRPGAADQSALLKALKLQTMVKVNNANRSAGIYRMANTSIHTASPTDRVQYNANQQAIQRSIFYSPV